MLLADRGVITPVLIVNTVIGTAMMTAGANTLNCVVDADIDKMMKRTEGRPLARGAVSTPRALALGVTLSVVSLVWLWWSATFLAAALAATTIAFYVVVYTMVIKRRTSHNVVWGGAANGMPVLIGWSAVAGNLAWQPLVVFAIVFFWTPPHSWALAMRHKQDYRAAGVPMLPAVCSDRDIAGQILVYTGLTVSATLALALATGWLYGAVGLAAATWLLVAAVQLYFRVRHGSPLDPLRLFQRSNSYLTVVFCALAVDSALALPRLLGG
jgi:protoheme IX farnesyltransferase